uniref:Serum amyloid A-1 protein-like n=1 Tax=Acanthochromis polyacanthus TaxID=80966 RepID=A0A3Q1GCF8_9TELE
MKLLLAGLVLLLIVEINAQLYNFPAEATQGELDMANAYDDREDANWKGSNTYNHQVAVKGTAKEWSQGVMGCGAEDTDADQQANRLEGNDPNHFRPEGLPDKY